MNSKTKTDPAGSSKELLGGRTRGQWWDSWCRAMKDAQNYTQFGISDASEERLDDEYRRLLNAAFPPNRDYAIQK